jgi:hypothetical protein
MENKKPFYKRHINSLIVSIIILVTISIAYATIPTMIVNSDNYNKLHDTYSKQTIPIIVSYPIYRATVPFGVFTLEQSATGFLVWFSASGSISETYYIKYMDGNQLKTVEFPARDMPLTVDGTFCYQVISYKIQNLNYYGDIISESIVTTDFLHTTPKTDISVHIPYLPNASENMTNGWVLP